MSSLISAYTFNEQGLHDYSGNKLHLSNTGITFSATSVTNGGFGYDAIFTSSSNGQNGNYPSALGYSAFTVFFNLIFTSLSSAITVATLNGVWAVGINTSGNVTFSTTENGTSTVYAMNSTATLSINTWYTIACIWTQGGVSSGTGNLYVYINGILDSNYDGANVIAASVGGGLFKLGDSSLQGNVNMFEYRNIAATADQLYAMNMSPGGVLYTCDSHSFIAGDLVADNQKQGQAVVTWPVDSISFYAYPYTQNMLGQVARYGNVYNTLRQYIMEITNDFDGNGNSQISIKSPIASFSDYNSPANEITFDYRGLNGAPKNNAMAITSLRM